MDHCLEPLTGYATVCRSALKGGELGKQIPPPLDQGGGPTTHRDDSQGPNDSGSRVAAIRGNGSLAARALEFNPVQPLWLKSKVNSTLLLLLLHF